MAPVDSSFEPHSSADGHGVRCTTDGAFLAGVPLLRRTIDGLLEPRPRGELATLLKSAYGPTVDPSRSYPGLDVITQALNRGDIGRAMVATVHLRLPRLNNDDALRVAYANETLSKYDSSEPRDERGRWTASGGAASNHPRVHAAGHRSPRRVPGIGTTTHMKPIRVSDPEDMEWTTPPISEAIILGFGHRCVSNAREPNFYNKTQACAEVSRQCKWLARVNADRPFRTDGCLWPDGSATVMKMGIMVPLKMGHPF